MKVPLLACSLPCNRFGRSSTRFGYEAMAVGSISLLIGLILTGTAALKLSAIIEGGEQFSQLWLEVLVVLYEFALGLGLLFASRRAGLWLVTLVTLLAFAGFNLNSLRIGQTSCGCFGAVAVSPWKALVLDVGVLAALAVWAGIDRRALTLRKAIPEATAFLLGFALSAVLWVVPVHLTFGSAEAVRARLRGDQVFLEPAALDFGMVSARTVAEAVLLVRNTGPGDVRVIGGTSNCFCTLLPDLPAIVPPNQACPLRVRLGVPARPGEFQFTAVLWTDSPINDAILVPLRGRSVGP